MDDERSRCSACGRVDEPLYRVVIDPATVEWVCEDCKDQSDDSWTRKHHDRLLVCSDFPDIQCCPGCHYEWGDDSCPDPCLYAVWTPSGHLAVVCCEIERELARRPGFRGGHLFVMAWLDERYGVGNWESQRRLAERQRQLTDDQAGSEGTP